MDYYKISFFFDAPKTTLKTSEITAVKTSEKIIVLIKENPAISAKEIAEKLGITPRAVEMQIAKLKKDKRIQRTGPDKGGRWEVVKNG